MVARQFANNHVLTQRIMAAAARDAAAIVAGLAECLRATPDWDAFLSRLAKEKWLLEPRKIHGAIDIHLRMPR